MNEKLWIAFAIASGLMGMIPGPGVVSIVGYALSSGRRVALAAVAGMAVGNTVAMTLSLFGVGAVLAASALAFSLVKWAGAIYLIGLGLFTIAKSKPADRNFASMPPLQARTAFLGNVAIGTFHPKTIIFFVAFVPQFIDSHKNYTSQAALLILTFVAVVTATDTAYALAASRLAHLLRQPRAALWSQRAGGGALVAAGVVTAAARQ